MRKYDLVMAGGAEVDDHDEKRLIEKGPLEGVSASLFSMMIRLIPRRGDY